MNPSNPNDCESQLRELGKSWKGDASFIEGVLNKLEQFESASNPI